jgi:NADH dehydrogenase [ubiquinone] 1 alpha subcomplex assembly factor 1
MLQLINFNDMESGSRWVTVNDDVMGGLSEGAPVLVDGLLQFHGKLSLANNGGFSSVRTVDQRFDFSEATAVVLRVRGDGRTYQLRLATEARYRGIAVSYGSEFATVAKQWIEVRVPLDSLTPTVRGSRLDGPPFDAAQVRELGLLIADKREGPFALDVDWIGME